MAVITVAHKPQLTAQDAMQVLSKQFSPKGYKVFKPKYVGKFVRFDVKRDGWTTASVRLKQKPDSTRFIVRYTFDAPGLWKLWLILFVPAPVVWLLKRPELKALEDEVMQFVQSCEDFN